MKSLTNRKLKIVGISIAMFLTIFTIVLVPIYSWFSSTEVTVYAPITTDTDLFIGAGHEEDIQYLSFEGIDVNNGEGNEKYTDYVFSVSGEFINAYNIQLAFTTNNQFEFRLYWATESSELTQAQADAFDGFVYKTQDDKYYGYTRGAQINGAYSNNIDNKIMGKDDDAYYTSTYGNYTYVNPYAIPLYWHTTNPIVVSGHNGTAFPHYFILRVVTTNKAVNDRETDVICISARATNSLG